MKDNLKLEKKTFGEEKTEICCFKERVSEEE